MSTKSQKEAGVRIVLRSRLKAFCAASWNCESKFLTYFSALLTASGGTRFARTLRDHAEVSVCFTGGVASCGLCWTFGALDGIGEWYFFGAGALKKRIQKFIFNNYDRYSIAQLAAAKFVPLEKFSVRIEEIARLALRLVRAAATLVGASFRFEFGIALCFLPNTAGNVVI